MRAAVLALFFIAWLSPAQAARYYAPDEVDAARRALPPVDTRVPSLLLQRLDAARIDAATDPLAGELALHALLLALREVAPDAALRSAVAALLDYSSEARTDLPDPDHGPGPTAVVAPIAGAARGTLRTWDLRERAQAYAAALTQMRVPYDASVDDDALAAAIATLPPATLESLANLAPSMPPRALRALAARAPRRELYAALLRSGDAAQSLPALVEFAQRLPAADASALLMDAASDAQIGSAAVLALGVLADERGVREFLLAHLGDVRLGGSAAQALAHDGSRATLDALAALLARGRDDPATRRARLALRWSADAQPARAFAPAIAANDITYVDTVPGSGCPTPRCDALGYPVPLPIDSQTPVAGFRRYDALQAHLQDLAATSSDLAESTPGRTLHDRAINAYVLGDADATTADGFAEPAVLIDGGIHAREWQAPETVAGLVERFTDRAADAGLYRYLLDTVTVVTIPVLNVDGFLQTQRYPDTALTDTFAGLPAEPSDWPRDGRMRRKNMRDVDEDLSTQADYLFGVDCNRNNAPFFGNLRDNSNDAGSLVYHGAAAGSENESQALYAAAQLGPEARLRMYVDTHSFGRVFDSVNTGNARHDQIQQSLYGTMSAVTGFAYTYAPTPANVGIGSTDEHFAYADQVPVYTLEIEPGPDGSMEYSGFGVTHDGFILPAAEMPRVRNELADALTAGIYRMAGPPAIARVSISDAHSGAVLFEAHWTRTGATTRRLDATRTTPLANDADYVLWVALDKPMRVRDGGGAIAQYPGQSVALQPSVAIEGVSAGQAWRVTPAGAAQWRANVGAAPAGARRWADDAFAVPFRVPASTASLAAATRIAVAVDVSDFTGQALDANPASAIDFASGSWQRYENSSGAPGDAGGTDRSVRVIDDGSPLFPPASAGGGSGGGGGGPMLPGALALLLLAVLRRRLPS
jgi:predicted deacylase